MLYLIYKWIAAHAWVSWIQPEGVFHTPIFRAAAAIMCSFLIVLAFGNRTIRWLLKQKVGDRPEFYNATLNELTKHKGNTPTMGGILIIGAIILTNLLLADLKNFYVDMALFCLVYLSALGAIDDWLKLTTAKRTPGSRDGLFAWEKLVFQLGLGVLLAMFIYYHADKINPANREAQARAQVSQPSPPAPPLTTSSPPNAAVEMPVAPLVSAREDGPTLRGAHKLNWPFMRDVQLAPWIFALITIIVITGTSNAVNLTDGMDGLAAGCMAIVAFAFLALAYVTGDFRWASILHFNWVQDTGELAVVCGSITGACLGFLWFNCNPAQVFMGDTGSLALGGVIGYVAIVIRQEPMLLLIGGIFVLEASSVMMQVSYFRFTGGKRIFLCSPIHHHFHLKGWSEQQVVVRFWLISALCAAFGLATVKLR